MCAGAGEHRPGTEKTPPNGQSRAHRNAEFGYSHKELGALSLSVRNRAEPPGATGDIKETPPGGTRRSVLFPAQGEPSAAPRTAAAPHISAPKPQTHLRRRRSPGNGRHDAPPAAPSMLRRALGTSLKCFANAKSQTFFFPPPSPLPLPPPPPLPHGAEEAAAFPAGPERAEGGGGGGDGGQRGAGAAGGCGGLRGQRSPPLPPPPSAAAAWKNAVCHFPASFLQHRTEV